MFTLACVGIKRAYFKGGPLLVTDTLTTGGMEIAHIKNYECCRSFHMASEK